MGVELTDDEIKCIEFLVEFRDYKFANNKKMKCDEPQAKKPKLKNDPTTKIEDLKLANTNSEAPIRKELPIENGDTPVTNGEIKLENGKSELKSETQNSPRKRRNLTQSPKVRQSSKTNTQNTRKRERENHQPNGNGEITKPTRSARTSSNNTPNKDQDNQPSTNNTPEKRDTRRSRRTEKLEKGSIKFELELDQQNFVKIKNLNENIIENSKFYAIIINLYYWNKRYRKIVNEIFERKKFINIVPDFKKFGYASISEAWEQLIGPENASEKTICNFQNPEKDDHVNFYTEKSDLIQLTSMIYNTIKNNADYIILNEDKSYAPPKFILEFAKELDYNKNEVKDCIHKAFCLHLHQLSITNKSG